MDEVATYIYVFAPVCGALLAGIGALVVTVSSQRLRQARACFVLSALPLFLVPITFGWTAHAPFVGLAVASTSGFVLGMIYYWGISILNEHIKDDPQNFEHPDS
jgi:hypothetical protein